MTTQQVEIRTTIPFHYQPRSYQRDFWRAMLPKAEGGGGLLRAILVWHRRAGKDKTVLNFTIAQMLRRVGMYFYVFPTYAQGKKVLWDGKGRDGFRFMDHFPGFSEPGTGIVKSRWEDEMKLELSNGSMFQIIGSDNMDSIRGANPVGCVFSEYAIMNPKAWDTMRPVLRENKGWAVFVYTPMGKNHGYRLWHHVVSQERLSRQWFVSMLTIADTRRDAPGEDGTSVVTEQDVQDDIAEGMPEALAQQEYYCSWEGFLHGSYYGDLIVRARAEKRIAEFPWDPSYVVDTAWDLGVDDSTAIVFTQTIRGVPRFVDYFEASGHGLPWYVSKLRREYDYSYGLHFGPHDMKVTEWGTGNTRVQTAGQLGLHFEVVPKLKIEDGIDATRKLLSKAVFNDRTVEKLLDILSSYRREWDDDAQTWGKQPVRDWTSHGSDATRYRAVAYYDPDLSRRTQSHARMSFDVVGNPADQEFAEQRGVFRWKDRWPEDGRWRNQQTIAET